MNTDQRAGQDDDLDLCDKDEAGAILHESPHTLRRWRLTGYGPPHVRLTPRRILYRRSDLAAFIRAQLRNSTSADGPPPQDGAA